MDRCASWRPTGRFLYGFLIGGTYYVPPAGRGPAADGERPAWSDSRERAVRGGAGAGAAAVDGGDTELLLGTFNRGLFRYDGRTFAPFTTEVDALLESATLYKGIALPDGTLGFSTISGGARHRGPAQGHALRYMNLATGLPNDNALAIFVDHAGMVWMALEGAICQVETPSPLSRFDIKAGLSGSVSDVVRHKGVLYVATSVGRLLPRLRHVASSSR